MVAALLAAQDGIEGGLILAILVGLALGALAAWVVMYFGVPQPLAALVGLIVFLLVVFGSGGFD